MAPGLAPEKRAGPMMSGVVLAGGRPARWPERVPVPLTDFIGRSPERAEVAQLLSGHRLVTLVGGGGVGKTRLAVEVAANAAHGFAGAVDFVDLAPVRDPASLPAIMARCFELEEWGDAAIEDRLALILRVSGGREPPPPALSGPDVTVSRHPAPTGRLAVKATSLQWTKSFGLRR